MGGGAELEEGPKLSLDWTKLDKVASKHCDVVPVVVQDTRSGAVLIVAYVNETALAETFQRRVACLWSTSRNELWVKGATSGDTLDLDDVMINCEQNSLIFKVTPRRKGACHTKDAFGNTRVSCYYRRVLQAGGSFELIHLNPDFGSSRGTLCQPCPAAADGEATTTPAQKTVSLGTTTTPAERPVSLRTLYAGCLGSFLAGGVLMAAVTAAISWRRK
jgi:phosphoribosyl-AMP cyclohydrolase